jgi:hypothetical protein
MIGWIAPQHRREMRDGGPGISVVEKILSTLKLERAHGVPQLAVGA